MKTKENKALTTVTTYQPGLCAKARMASVRISPIFCGWMPLQHTFFNHSHNNNAIWRSFHFSPPNNSREDSFKITQSNWCILQSGIISNAIHTKDKKEMRYDKGTKKIDIIGQRYAMLVVEKELERNAKGGRRFLCRCDCGESTIVTYANLTSGNTRSCGCYKAAELSKRTKLAYELFLARKRSKEKS